MASALVQITDTVTHITQPTGLDYAVLGRTYALANANDTGVAAWRWALRTKPVGSAATIGAVNSPNISFAPDVAGTYMFLLQVYSDVEATELVGAGTAAIGVRESVGGVRIPGIGEVGEINSQDGWAASVNETLKFILANLGGGGPPPHKIIDASGDTYVDTEFTSGSDQVQTAAHGTIIALQTQALSAFGAAPTSGQAPFLEVGQGAPSLSVLGGTTRVGAGIGTVDSTFRTQWAAAVTNPGDPDVGYVIEGRIFDPSDSTPVDQRISATRSGAALSGEHLAAYASGQAGFEYTLNGGSGDSVASLGAQNPTGGVAIVTQTTSSSAYATTQLSFGSASGIATLYSPDAVKSYFGVSADVLQFALFPETRNDGPRYAALDAGGSDGSVNRGPVVLGELYTQTAHGFSVTLGAIPIPVYYAPGTGWVRATTASTSTVAEGVIVQTPDANTLLVVSAGYTDLTPGHGLSDGYYYFLSNTPPYYTTLEPSYGNIVQALWRMEGDRLFVLGQPARIETPPVGASTLQIAYAGSVTAGDNPTINVAAGTLSIGATPGTVFSVSPTAVNVGFVPLSMGSQKITNLLDPTSAQDAATKNYVDSHTGSLPPVRYAGALGKSVVRLGSEELIGAVGAVNPSLFGASPTITFDAMFLFAPGTSGSVEIRLYDMGTRASPTAGTLRSTISASYTTAGVFQALSRTLTVTGSPGTNVDQIANSEIIYELRAILIGATPGDSLLVEGASLTITAGGVVGGTTTVNWTTVSAAVASATSSLSVNTQKITNVVDPTSPQDAATKNYVDTVNHTFATFQTVAAGFEGTLSVPVVINTGANAVECTSAAADTYLQLPTLANAPVGSIIQVTKANVSSFKIHVTPDPGSSINGGTTNALVDVPNSIIPSSTSTGSSATPDVSVTFRRNGSTTWRMA